MTVSCREFSSLLGWGTGGLVVDLCRSHMRNAPDIEDVAQILCALVEVEYHFWQDETETQVARILAKA